MMGYCGDCEYLTNRHNCKKYKKKLAYSCYDSKSVSHSSHERCSECDKDHYIAELSERMRPKKVVKTDTCSQACPICGHPVNQKFCSNCGQALSY